MYINLFVQLGPIKYYKRPFNLGYLKIVADDFI